MLPRHLYQPLWHLLPPQAPCILKRPYPSIVQSIFTTHNTQERLRTLHTTSPRTRKHQIEQLQSVRITPVHRIPDSGHSLNLIDTPLRQYNIHGFVQHPTLTNPVQSFAIPPVPTTHLGADPEDAFEDPEDPFDVDMDDSDMSFNDAAESLQGMLDRSGKTNSQQSSQSNARRRQPQTVATYKPTVITSPLRDERNERIFCHFVEITSHCMSIFERHHYAPISLPSRTLWNFTIPALAMSHAALAHSILALGALHLAKLQGLSEDNAVKHFTYSVRRVGKLLGLPKRRHEIATLATVLVLGFYEILTGDHSRWFLHLGGATRLMMEHDYAALTRTARRMRSGAKARVHQRTTQFALTEENYARVAGIPLALLDDVDWEVDAQLVSRLVGLPVDYDTQHQPGFPSPGFSMDLSTNDVEEFKVKMDLRWWYCKQDIFGSMISGDPLLMPFENYIYCPPRGQIGRSDNPYATLDHMLLIMGRITDFGGKDRARKQRAVKSQGGQWRPPPWLFPQGPPGGPPGGPRGGPGGMMSGGPTRPPQHESQATSMQDPKTVLPNTSGMNKTKVSMAPSANEGRVRRQSRQGPPGESPPGAPPMYGMMPTSSVTTEMNSAYKAMDASMKDPAFQNKREERQVSPPKSLEEETARAFAEHESITKAFDLYRSCLGPDFDQLPLSDVTPYSTPFGPALIYKNPAIANLWLFYNVGRILLHRFHPEMPPAAMISAGVTAHLTKDYAQTVGRICAGLYSPHYYGQKGPLDPGFAGALMESTFQLLFAAVQFQDAAQRGWTITKLQDVALRCGWQTSGAVAAACEIAWERMGQAGRGPPYERTLDVNNKDVRVSGKFSRDASASTNNFRKSDDAVADYELEFVNHDRNLIDRSGSTRTHWALGLLSVEEDIKKMTIDDE